MIQSIPSVTGMQKTGLHTGPTDRNFMEYANTGSCVAFLLPCVFSCYSGYYEYTHSVDIAVLSQIELVRFSSFKPIEDGTSRRILSVNHTSNYKG